MPACVCSSAACSQDPAKISLAGVYLGQVFVAICAVTIISAEYGTGMIRTTLTAMPNRVEVLAAKAIVAAGWALAAGVVGVVGSAVLGQLLLPGKGFTPANGYPSLALSDCGMLRAASGSVLYLVLIALLSLGIATSGARFGGRHRASCSGCCSRSRSPSSWSATRTGTATSNRSRR